MTTFTMRIELTNLTAARNEYEALGDYLTSLEEKYDNRKKTYKIEAKDEVTPSEPEEKPVRKKGATKPKPEPKPDPKEEEKPEPKQEVAKEEKELETPPEDNSLTHHDLVGMAREAVKRCGDRTKVDKIIKRYGATIPSITANNFDAVASELQAV